MEAGFARMNDLTVLQASQVCVLATVAFLFPQRLLDPFAELLLAMRLGIVRVHAATRSRSSHKGGSHRSCEFTYLIQVESMCLEPMPSIRQPIHLPLIPGPSKQLRTIRKINSSHLPTSKRKSLLPQRPGMYSYGPVYDRKSRRCWRCHDHCLA